jgi:hypothetical protein
VVAPLLSLSPLSPPPFLLLPFHCYHSFFLNTVLVSLARAPLRTWGCCAEPGGADPGLWVTITSNGGTHGIAPELRTAPPRVRPPDVVAVAGNSGYYRAPWFIKVAPAMFLPFVLRETPSWQMTCGRSGQSVRRSEGGCPCSTWVTRGMALWKSGGREGFSLSGAVLTVLPPVAASPVLRINRARPPADKLDWSPGFFLWDVWFTTFSLFFPASDLHPVLLPLGLVCDEAGEGGSGARQGVGWATGSPHILRSEVLLLVAVCSPVRARGWLLMP